MQFFTHLILFLLIGFVILWWQQYSMLTTRASSESPLTAIPNNLDPALNLELAANAETAGTFAINPEPRSRRELKKTMRILTTLVLFSLISLVSMWWYNNSGLISSELSRANTELLSAVSAVTQPTPPMTAKEETISAATTPAAKIESVQAVEKVTQANTPVQPQINSDDQMASISSGSYTPVPEVKNTVSKKHRRKSVPVAEPVEDFSDLD